MVQGNTTVPEYHRQRLPSWRALFDALTAMINRMKEGGATVAILEEYKVAGMGLITVNG